MKKLLVGSRESRLAVLQTQAPLVYLPPLLLCSLITGAVTGGISTLLVRRVPAAPFERKSL